MYIIMETIRKKDFVLPCLLITNLNNFRLSFSFQESFPPSLPFSPSLTLSFSPHSPSLSPGDFHFPHPTCFDSDWKCTEVRKGDRELYGRRGIVADGIWKERYK